MDKELENALKAQVQKNKELERVLKDVLQSKDLSKIRDTKLNLFRRQTNAYRSLYIKAKNKIEALEKKIEHIERNADEMVIERAKAMCLNSLKNELESVNYALIAGIDKINIVLTKKEVVDIVLRTIGNNYGLRSDIILKKTRQKNIVKCRHLAMYYLHSYLDSDYHEFTLIEIAGLLNLTDHSTVIHGINRVNDDMDTNRKLKKEYLEIFEEITNNIT